MAKQQYKAAKAALKEVGSTRLSAVVFAWVCARCVEVAGVVLRGAAGAPLN
eukprot:COSAG01_NODE_2890_length_6906_cov_23.470545_8_plen_51_part_00